MIIEGTKALRLEECRHNRSSAVLCVFISENLEERDFYVLFYYVCIALPALEK
jgi:hypothetical protein